MNAFTSPAESSKRQLSTCSINEGLVDGNPEQQSSALEAVEKRQKIDWKSGRRLHDNGISHTLSSQSKYKITAVIKHRFSDFIVNEISEDRGIIRLTDLQYHDPSAPDVHGTVSGTSPASVLVDKLTPLLSLEAAEKISRLVESADTFVSEPIDDKVHRTSIHNVCKAHRQISSKTLEDGSISFKSCKKLKVNWDDLGGSYLHFTLFKENRETSDTISDIAKRLKVPAKNFSFAGNKDKRGVTTQLVSAYRINATHLSKLNGAGWDCSDKKYGIIRVGDYRYSKTDLRLGDLKGNRFCVTLRDINPPNITAVRESIGSLGAHGFINYFGLQRFGTSSTPTWKVGLAILNGEYDKAVDLIMQPKENDRENWRIAREHWAEHKDVDKALELFPHACLAERAILTCYSKTGKVRDAATALTKITKNLRLMYLHSYQSYIWNHVASQRIRALGQVVAIGDIVLVNQASAVSKTTGGNTPQHAIFVDEFNISAYSITDVVLPLIGWDVLYPKNMVAAYRELMAADGVDCEGMRRKERDHSLPGAYRKIVAEVRAIEARFYRYSDEEAPLSRSDVDVRNQVADIEGEIVGDVWERAGVEEDGSKLACVLAFELGSSCYATMAVREVVECEE